MKIVTGGKIASYGLTDWWLSEFSEEERTYIDDRLQPYNQSSHTLTQGNYLTIEGVSYDAISFLSDLSSSFEKKEDAAIYDRIRKKLYALAKDNPQQGGENVRGRHYTTYVEEVKQLKREGKLDEAKRLLLELVAATEYEAENEGCGVAPWYYEHLAIIYRKQKDFAKEVAIIERFANQSLSPGSATPKLLQRLEKARVLLNKEG